MHAARTEIRTLQALRAAACLLVVVFHATDGTWANGAAGVDLFFVISGLVMGLSSTALAGRADGWQVFAARRLQRLVPLYWSLTAAKLAIGIAIPATLAATRPGAWNIVASFLFIPSRDGADLIRPVLGVGWTLQFEMLFYALFALALAWRVHPLRVLPPILIPLAIAGFWHAPGWPAPLVLANGLVLEFCMGLALASLPTQLGRLHSNWGWLLAAAGLATLALAPSHGNWRFVTWGVPATSVVAAALILERRIGSHVSAVLLGLGEASYAIYLAHPFLVPPVVHAAHAMLGSSAGGQLCAIAGCLVAASSAGLALDRLFDRKVQAWLRRTCSGAGLAARAPAQLVEL